MRMTILWSSKNMVKKSINKYYRKEIFENIYFFPMKNEII